VLSLYLGDGTVLSLYLSATTVPSLLLGDGTVLSLYLSAATVLSLYLGDGTVLSLCWALGLCSPYAGPWDCALPVLGARTALFPP